MTAPHSSVTREARAMWDWWQMAGVDCDFADNVTDWLANADVSRADQALADERRAQASTASGTLAAGSATVEKKPPPADLFADGKPQTLPDFQRWWREAPGLDTIGPRGRVSPCGKSEPVLMVLVLHPEERDRDTLLDGPQGRLLTNILAAMELARDDLYIASALPRHTPMADTAAIAAAGMNPVIAHHVDLVSPQRLLAFGTGLLPLFGLDATDQERLLRSVDCEWQSRPLLMNEGLDAMMTMPRLKSRFWKRWLAWTNEP